MKLSELTTNLLEENKVIRRSNHDWIQNDKFVFPGRLREILLAPEVIQICQNKKALIYSKEVTLFINENGKIRVWQPTQYDIVANDWEYVHTGESALG
jgi:hypothetical protein